MSPQIRIVLVEPLYQGNVGSVTRSMENFGFDDLVLVNPCKLEGQARAMSCHAHDLLESSPKVETLEEAIEDTDIVIGTSGIAGIKTDQHIRMPAYTPSEIRDKFRETNGKIAFLFGREDNGFTREELKRCDMIMTIPTSEKYPIMNISHAATVTMYEMSNLEIGERPIADGFDLQLLYDHFEKVLADIKHPKHKMEKTSIMLKRIFGRAELTPREVQTLRGVLRDIQRQKK